MPTLKLNKSTIDTYAPHPERDVWLWDETMPGFGVRVKPSGVKSFVVQYRTRTRQPRKQTLGSVKLLPLQEARDRARRILVDVRDGKDPAAEVRLDREAMTLNQVFDRFKRDYMAKKLKPSSVHSYAALYERYVRGGLGKRPFASITRKDVVELHGKLSDQRYSGNRVVAVLKRIFNVALHDWELVKNHGNPCARVAMYPEDEREVQLNKGQLAALWDGLDKFTADYPYRKHLADLFRLLLLTGARKAEWTTARWDNVDFERGLLVLSDSKTGAKLIELPGPALDILRERYEVVRDSVRLNPRGFVLSDDQGKTGILYPYVAWREIVEAAGLQKGLRLHDLRHVFGSYAHRHGASQKTVAQLLGHKTLAMTERYIQGFSDARREAADVTATALLSAVAEGRSSVVPIRAVGGRTASRASAHPSASPRQRKKPAR